MSSSRFKTVAAMTAVALLGGVGATAANATFTDVPGEGQYAEHIENLQEAGIATGFADGSFRPTANMNRRQTAAWLDRAASRVGLSDPADDQNDSVVLDAANPTTTLATIEMTSPAAGDGRGWVTLQGGVGGLALEGGENCPCTVLVNVHDSNNALVGRTILTILNPEGGLAFTTAALFVLTPLAAGETETYSVNLQLFDTDVTVGLSGAAFGLYTPLAEGEPSTAIIEGAGTDPVESLVPEIPAFANS